jgi:O-antigen ligase
MRAVSSSEQGREPHLGGQRNLIGPAARAVFFVLLPAISVAGALALPVLIYLAGALSLRISLLRRAWASRPIPVLMLLGFTALAAGSSTWSPYPAAGMQALKVAVLVTGGLLFAAAAAQDPRLTRAGAVAAFVVLAILLSIEAIWALPLSRAAHPEAEIGDLGRNVTRGSVVLLALTWAAAAALLDQPGKLWAGLAAAVVAAGGVIALQFSQFANVVAFGAGLAAFALALIAPRLALSAVLCALVLWLFASPFVTLQLFSDPQLWTNLPASWDARVGIWNYVCERILEQPWFGHGLDAARTHAPLIPVHPHSASLQIWFEMGALGVLTTAALIIAAGRDLMCKFVDNRPAAAAAAGTIGALGIVLNVSYNLWAEWWLATLFLAAGVIGALQSDKRAARRR